VLSCIFLRLVTSSCFLVFCWLVVPLRMACVLCVLLYCVLCLVIYIVASLWAGLGLGLLGFGLGVRVRVRVYGEG
jgi:hypothetical protein